MSYEFETASPVTIDVFDIRGALLTTQIDTDVYVNKELSINMSHALPRQMYFIKVTSDKGSIIKKVISN